MSLKKFIFNKLTLIAVIFASFYQLIMIGINLNGYKYASKHLDESTIVYVNHDGKTGQEMIDNLVKNLDFKDKQMNSVKKGKQLLEDHEAALVLEVPKDYTKDLSQGKSVSLNYYVNSAGDSMSRSLGSNVATNITDKVNETVTSKKMQKIMSQLMLASAKDQIEEDVKKTVQSNPGIATDAQKLEQVKQDIIASYTKNFDEKAKELASSRNVTAKITDVNNKGNQMNQTMAPMLSSLAGFVAAMTASTIIFSSFDYTAKESSKNKWKAFFGLEVVAILVSLGAACVAALTVYGINAIEFEEALKLFASSVLNILVSFQVVIFTNLLVGQAAILINLPLTLTQSITSGSIMQESLMPPIYQFVRHFLPVPSTYQLNLNILFGTTTTKDPVSHLLVLGVGYLLVSLIIVFIDRKSVV